MENFSSLTRKLYNNSKLSGHYYLTPVHDSMFAIQKRYIVCCQVRKFEIKTHLQRCPFHLETSLKFKVSYNHVGRRICAMFNSWRDVHSPCTVELGLTYSYTYFLAQQSLETDIKNRFVRNDGCLFLELRGFESNTKHLL